MIVVLTRVTVASQVAYVLVEVANPGVQNFVGAGVMSMFPLLVLALAHRFVMSRTPIPVMVTGNGGVQWSCRLIRVTNQLPSRWCGWLCG